MNLYEKKQKLMAAFDDAKSFADVNAIKDQLDEVVKQISDAEAADATLKAAGGHGVAGGMSLGQYAAKNLDYSKLKGSRGTVSTGYGFKANTDAITGSQIVQTSTNVVDVIPRPLMVRDLFGVETISGNALQYYVLGATEGKPAVTAEGAAKPQISVSHAPVTVPLDKVACFFKESDEILEDAAFLVSAIDNRGTYEHNLAVESYLVSKLLATSGIQSTAFATSAQDSIFAGMTSVQLATGYTADAIVINPVDYQALRLARDSNGQYYGGGFFYGAYASAGGVQAQPGIWGLPTVVTPNIAKGTAIVGSFKAAGAVVTKAGSGLRVEMTNSADSDFTNNLVTIRIEERLTLAIRVPSAFTKVALASA